MYSTLSHTEKAKLFLYIPAVWLIFYIIVASYNYYIFFNDSFMAHNKILKNLISIIFYFFGVMAIICHTLTILEDPGTFNRKIVTDILQYNEKELCRKCSKLRPIRAHHCSRCNRCFMKLDHHCPWVFNCIGVANHKIFILFLIYTILSSLISFSMFVKFLHDFSGEIFFYTHVRLRKLDFLDNSFRIFGNDLKNAGHYILIIFGVILNFLTLTFVSSLFLTQMNLIKRNITNIENDIYEDDESENPFYTDENVLFVLSNFFKCKQKWKIFFPFVEPNLYHGGYVFKIPKKKK